MEARKTGRERKEGKESLPQTGTNSQSPRQESDTLTTEPSVRGAPFFSLSFSDANSCSVFNYLCTNAFPLKQSKTLFQSCQIYVYSIQR